ncbi:dihydrolipoyl dehydrogenase [Palleronia sp.]|uniref:dihydrolipoyl dehydrogenase n=1 Tax=Palleronia sp. TaxID=1940284 RepID=UPI0035C87BBC
MTTHTCDVAVIGAGTTGLSAVQAARDAGGKVLLIDPDFVGTMCANYGCMPSKLLLASANAAHAARGLGTFGIRTGSVEVDGPAVFQRVRKLRDDFAASARETFDKLPTGTCIEARARFTGPTTLSLDTGDTVEAGAVVIATGSSPMIPPPLQGLGELALTNRTVFDLEDLPRRLAVLGGGAIGLELAQGFARLGVEVTLLDKANTLGGARDPDVQKAVHEAMAEEMTLRLGVSVEGERRGDEVHLSWDGESSGTGSFDRVLVATGRPPNLDGLGLDATGIACDDKGVPEFNPRTLQCGDAPIFIAGDANADRPVLHEASEEGALAGRNAVAFPAVTAVKRVPPFTVTFTDPPLVQIGEGPSEDGSSGTSRFEDQGRAKIENRNRGVVRLFGTLGDGRLVGAELFAPGAEHMSHFLLLAIMNGMTASSVAEVPFYHPTLEEGLSAALSQICSNTPMTTPGRWQNTPPPGA